MLALDNKRGVIVTKTDISQSSSVKLQVEIFINFSFSGYMCEK